jgi:hypothetical protein
LRIYVLADDGKAEGKVADQYPLREYSQPGLIIDTGSILYVEDTLYRLNHFMIRVARFHARDRELSSSSIEYQKAALVVIEQGVSDTLCSLDPDLIPWEILYQVEVLFQYLDRHIVEKRLQPA